MCLQNIDMLLDKNRYDNCFTIKKRGGVSSYKILINFVVIYFDLIVVIIFKVFDFILVYYGKKNEKQQGVGFYCLHFINTNGCITNQR